jgi:4-amino-4-deoxy-L-arabinose transferase-like glycosyltransferase
MHPANEIEKKAVRCGTSLSRPVSSRVALLGLIGVMMLGWYLRSGSMLNSVTDALLSVDARDYLVYAWNTVHHGVYSIDPAGVTADASVLRPDAVRSPGYPLFLMPFMGDGKALIDSVNDIRFSQVVLSTLTIALGFWFFRGFLGPIGSLSAALLTALSPHLVVMPTYVLTETLFAALLVLSGLAFGRLMRRPVWPLALLAGAVLGLADLVRPSIHVFPVIAGALIIDHVRTKKGAVLAATCLLGFILAVAPWLVRNAISLNQLTDSTLQINFLHHGMYPDFMYNNQRYSFGRPYAYDPRSPEISKDRQTVLKEIAHKFQEEPFAYASWYFLKKPVAYWQWSIVQGFGDVFINPVSRTPYWENPLFIYSHRLMKSLHVPLAAAAALGCLLVWLPAVTRTVGREALFAARFVALVLLYFTALHMVGAPFPRYSIPLRPFLYGMAIFAVAAVWNGVKAHKAAPAGENFFATRDRACNT